MVKLGFDPMPTTKRSPRSPSKTSGSSISDNSSPNDGLGAGNDTEKTPSMGSSRCSSPDNSGPLSAPVFPSSMQQKHPIERPSKVLREPRNRRLKKLKKEGPMKGKAIAGRTIAFKVFALSNNVALFISLSIVVILVSIIPFRRRPLMNILMIAHKAKWLAVSFMATSYVAATWVIMPYSKGGEWMLVSLLAVGGGIMGMVFLGLSIMLIENWHKKRKWRAFRTDIRQGDASQDSDSFNSDVECNHQQGYHSQ
ncbi:hypothetical protein K2173_015709 [Erythroxylum novogranatense]|uniref:PGG domain-containing protein n=1 Tax=Erythroxylum novogranatense TaxID=1862640 RepID=A0AAV8SEE0_9ROSI|nr:hypothetical protein K2173_015709 [Erythroxylum novogranatense]